MAQKYQVLARKYRPQRFSEVVGQEAILTTLRNALKRESIAHAYLFCGSRGVGKTTLARLFAKALNCASPANGEPCSQCPSCVEIASGQSLDVIEIDGASNRGIDDIRQINETVGFAPSHGKYKIYIIDEVHMLTKEAFNALLKTLEEPPEQVKFFFATTEPHKVLPTIISRCQRFDLGRLLPTQIEAKLASIARDLNRAIEPEALHLLAQFADGSLRDAESLFDQILCFSTAAVTADDVRNTLGLAPAELFDALDQAFSSQHLGYAFELTAQLYDTGKDLSHFLDQLIEHYRHLAVCKTLTDKALPAALCSRYAAAASHYTQAQTLSILDLLIKAESTLAKSASPRTTLELTLLNLLRTKNRLPIETLVRRLNELEEKLSAAPPTPQLTAPVPISPPAPKLPEPAAPILKPNPPEPIAPPAPKLPEPAAPILKPNPPEPAAPPAPKLPEPMPLPPQVKGPELVEVPFNPIKSAPLVVEPPVLKPVVEPPKPKAPEPQLDKHPSHYETVIRFAAVELEGTVKK